MILRRRETEAPAPMIQNPGAGLRYNPCSTHTIVQVMASGTMRWTPIVRQPEPLFKV
jgi:hypothetical protein